MTERMDTDWSWSKRKDALGSFAAVHAMVPKNIERSGKERRHVVFIYSNDTKNRFWEKSYKWQEKGEVDPCGPTRVTLLGKFGTYLYQ